MSTYVIYDPLVELDRFFNEALSSRYSCGAAPRRRDHVDSVIKPRLDLHEDTEKNTVTATIELPGISKENVNIDVHNNRLIVTAENKLSPEYDGNGYVVRERRYGKFSRTLQLPQGVKDSEVKASLDDGILTVTFPKTTPEMEPKKVQVA